MENTPYDHMPHYWWYRYLQNHDGYALCCRQKDKGGYADTYKDFGNVHSETFPVWWKKREKLFIRERFDIHNVQEIGDIARVIDLDQIDTEDALVLVINLLEPKRVLQRAFNKLLKEKHTSKRGAPVWEYYGAKIELYERPHVANLKTTLAVYEMKKANAKMRLWQIGEACGVGSKLTETGVRPASYDTQGQKGDDYGLKREVMTAAVARLMRHAKALIHNAAEGEFPNRTPR